MKIVDFYGKNVQGLMRKSLWLFDMYGTVCNESSVFDGVKLLLNHIRETGGQYVFITNNSSHSIEHYVKWFNKMDIGLSENDFFTSTHATALYLNDKFPEKQVFCLGSESLVNELRFYGVNVITEPSESAAVVLVGYDTDLTYNKLRYTCKMLTQNIPYIATNPDLACPVDFGYIPDCGAICGMLKCATGRTPHYIGKPSPDMIKYVAKKFNISLADTVIVGDRIYTDIAAGINAGISTVCVLSGESNTDEISQSTIKPDYVFENIDALYKVLNIY